MNPPLEEQVVTSINNLKLTTQQEKRWNQRRRKEHHRNDEDQYIRQEVSHESSLSLDVTSLSMDHMTKSDGFLLAKQNWQFFLSPTNRRDHFPSLTQPPKPEPALTAIMFRIAQNRSTTALRPVQTAVTSDRRTRPVGSRRLNVNSIRHSAYTARNEKKLQMRRAKTPKEASLSGRSLRTLHQITHVEAIAASELEKRRNEWLEGEEMRKNQERRKLQNKVNYFIAKVEEDKKRLLKLQNKALNKIVNLEVRGKMAYTKPAESDLNSKNENKE